MASPSWESRKKACKSIKLPIVSRSMRSKQLTSQADVVLDLGSLSKKGLRVLEAQDSFMYHSIPSVH